MSSKFLPVNHIETHSCPFCCTYLHGNKLLIWDSCVSLQKSIIVPCILRSKPQQTSNNVKETNLDLIKKLSPPHNPSDT